MLHNKSKKLNKRYTLIIIFFMLLAFVVFFVFVKKYINNKKNNREVVINSLCKTVTNMTDFSSSELGEYMHYDNLMEYYSKEPTNTDILLKVDYINPLLKMDDYQNSSANILIQRDIIQKQNKLSVNVNDNLLFDSYCDDNTLYMLAPSLSDKYLSLNTTDIQNVYKNSPWYDGKNFPLDSINLFSEINGNYIYNFLSTLYNENKKDFNKILGDIEVNKSKKQNIEIDNKNVKCTKYSIVITPDDINSLTTLIANHLVNTTNGDHFFELSYILNSPDLSFAEYKSKLIEDFRNIPDILSENIYLQVYLNSNNDVVKMSLDTDNNDFIFSMSFDLFGNEHPYDAYEGIISLFSADNSTDILINRNTYVENNIINSSSSIEVTTEKNSVKLSNELTYNKDSNGFYSYNGFSEQNKRISFSLISSGEAVPFEADNFNIAFNSISVKVFGINVLSLSGELDTTTMSASIPEFEDESINLFDIPKIKILELFKYDN